MGKMYGFKEMGFMGVGLWVILVRERWFERRERDGFVGFEREEERFGGGEGHGRRWEEELEKTWI
jgi:hypothetical protein